MDARQWKIRIFDTFSTIEFTRFGTYEQVRNKLSGLPPSYIWSIE
jgi:hypothetical protein